MKRLILLIAVVGTFGGFGLANALQVEPSQEFGKQFLQGQALQVEPVEVTSFNQLTEPDDIQPAGGYNLVQRTANPQAQVRD